MSDWGYIKIKLRELNAEVIYKILIWTFKTEKKFWFDSKSVKDFHNKYNRYPTNFFNCVCEKKKCIEKIKKETKEMLEDFNLESSKLNYEKLGFDDYKREGKKLVNNCGRRVPEEWRCKNCGDDTFHAITFKVPEKSSCGYVDIKEGWFDFNIKVGNTKFHKKGTMGFPSNFEETKNESNNNKPISLNIKVKGDRYELRVFCFGMSKKDYDKENKDSKESMKSFVINKNFDFISKGAYWIYLYPDEKIIEIEPQYSDIFLLVSDKVKRSVIQLCKDINGEHVRKGHTATDDEPEEIIFENN